MEILIRLGADKRKAKIIKEQLNEINELKKELKELKMEHENDYHAIRQLKRSIGYYKGRTRIKNENSRCKELETRKNDRTNDKR